MKTLLTGEQQEAIAERAAILEYDSGFDRRAATLRAFELCFPVDYAECMKAVAETATGETALYEFLEGLVKTGPESAEKGPPLSAETKKATQHGHAPEEPPKGREKRNGLEGLKAYVKRRTA